MVGLEPLQLALFKRVLYQFSDLYRGNKRTPPLPSERTMLSYAGRGWVVSRPYGTPKIKNEQLGAHLEALMMCGLLRTYSIERNTTRDGFNFTFAAGNGTDGSMTGRSRTTPLCGFRLIPGEQESL